MKSPLNSPLEVGVRVLALLAQAFPDVLDVNRLVLLDHALIHSEDLGGPSSIHPPLPIRAGEFGVRRRTIAQGMECMIRAGLAETVVTESGIEFRAGDGAETFMRLLESKYARRLHERAAWAVSMFGDLNHESLRQQMRQIFSAWSEEFDDFAGAGS